MEKASAETAYSKSFCALQPDRKVAGLFVIALSFLFGSPGFQINPTKPE
jgi:hypothetical protein